MHSIFELFVAEYLTEHFATHPTFSIKTKPNIWLDKEGRMHGEPDILLHKAGKRYMILDTKYKNFKGAPERDDLNQMYTYCGTAGVHKALLIYSDAREINDQWDFENIKIAAKTIALDGDLITFQERCRIFANGFIKELVTEF